MKKKICLVEDEAKVAAFIAQGLQEHDFEVTLSPTGGLAEDLINRHDFDLIILDVMLPDMNGMDLCRQIRQQHTVAPILMLTALDQVDNKVSGLDAGADDYLVKPFHFNELLARINALLRRQERLTPAEAEWLSFSDLKLNTWTKVAERAGREIILTSKEYALLELFLRNPNRTLSRETIAEIVWGIQFDTGTNFIDVYVNYLRKKIEKGFDSKLIHTVIGMGYILKQAR